MATQEQLAAARAILDECGYTITDYTLGKLVDAVQPSGAELALLSQLRAHDGFERVRSDVVEQADDIHSEDVADAWGLLLKLLRGVA